jgi:hypothetical protein
MDTNVIIIEEKRKVKVILTDHVGIRAVGVTVCHEDDTFDATIGEKIATLHAWAKYCTKKAKYSRHEAAEWAAFEARAAKKAVDYTKDAEFNERRVVLFQEELKDIIAEMIKKETEN